ncbi:hypothetical protein TrRE_jg4289, partial [Triparma retinervis]
MSVVFSSPRSYTGEDLVELHVHGSRAVVAGVLDDLSLRPGLRQAERGEFTMRAYANGKLSLYEVEGLGSLLTADTSRERVQALESAGGKEVLEEWRRVLVGGMAHAEAIIDFSADGDNTDLQDTGKVWGGVREKVRDLRERMER